MKEICGYCKYWGDGDGTGIPYDAGHMNDCNNPQISGNHHPSYGVGGETKTMIWASTCNDGSKRFSGSASQIMMTRITFGCNLFEPTKKKVR